MKNKSLKIYCAFLKMEILQDTDHTNPKRHGSLNMHLSGVSFF